MMKAFLVLIFLFCSSGFASSEPPYNQGEFLSKLQNNSVSMNRSPIIAAPSFLEHVYELHKKTIPSFKRELLNYHYYTEGVWTYVIMWDWVGYRCVFGIDKKNSDPKDPRVYDRKEFTKRFPGDTPATVGEEIKKSFCEKLYGFPL